MDSERAAETELSQGATVRPGGDDELISECQIWVHLWSWGSLTQAGGLDHIWSYAKKDGSSRSCGSTTCVRRVTALGEESTPAGICAELSGDGKEQGD